jgi:hypothetical protein
MLFVKNVIGWFCYEMCVQNTKKGAAVVSFTYSKPDCGITATVT